MVATGTVTPRFPGKGQCAGRRRPRLGTRLLSASISTDTADLVGLLACPNDHGFH